MKTIDGNSDEALPWSESRAELRDVLEADNCEAMGLVSREEIYDR